MLRHEDLARLSPSAQRQIIEKLGQKAHTENYHKYNAEKSVRGNICFDSKKEARRFDELRVLLKAGRISDLKLQPQFTLQEGFKTTDGIAVRAIRYYADFSYKDKDGNLVVEDVKGVRTREYALKKKLMQERFGIEVQEI